ncbi:MAG TPA: NAD(P)-dependent alcohol dehydrogenase [Mycobacteriales bacterium]|nr:NAD(P)-dependent alcohol dehydrogenase [Mycobacteriales bacterium]
MTDEQAVPERMRASVLSAPGRIEVEERAVPAPRPDEVLIKVASVGVCGSDVHYYRHGRIGDFVVDAPLVLGHEASGRIVAVGADVPAERIGERVAIEPQMPCRKCRFCKTGRLNLCPQMRFYATPPIDGAFCEYVTIGADFAHPVPDAVSDDAAALLEPVSVGVWACRKAQVRPGSSVLIAGAGPIGAVTVLAARTAGADEIVVSDPVESRRTRIASLGATRTVDPTAEKLPDAHFDAFIDCSGAMPAVLSGIPAVAGGGWIVLVGMGADEMELPISVLQARELNITGVFRYVDTWPAATAVALQNSLDSLVTARFGLDEVEAALNADNEPSSMKSIVEPWR